ISSDVRLWARSVYEKCFQESMTESFEESFGLQYPHLGLTAWPFVIVPDENFHSFIADRHAFRQELANLVRNLARRPGASFHLIWSWLGSGKTHALHYMGHLCRSEHTGLLPIYTEFPRSPRGFVDLYASF